MKSWRAAKHYYLYACIVFWSSVTVLLVGWYSNQTTISYVGATSLTAYLILLAGTAGMACLMFLFARKWFFHHARAGRALRIFFYTMIAATLIAGLVPATSGFPAAVHSCFATVLSFSLVAILAVFAVQSKYSQPFRSLAAISIVLMAVFIFGLSGIVGQALAIAAFNVFILAGVYAKLLES